MSQGIDQKSEIKINTLTPATMRQIIMNGKHYKPAYTHYGNDPDQNICCDRCFANSLEECYGNGLYDLCLKCKDEVEKMLKPQEPVHNKNLYGNYRNSDVYNYTDNHSDNHSDNRSTMEQSHFITKLEQGQFKPDWKTRISNFFMSGGLNDLGN